MALEKKCSVPEDQKGGVKPEADVLAACILYVRYMWVVWLAVKSRTHARTPGG